jgi:hypothetical protein
MSMKISHRTVRVASAAALCLGLAFGTAGVAMAGQHSYSHGHSSFGHHDQGQSADFAGGVVTALGTNSITVKDRHGDTTTYTTSSTTTYFEGKTAVTVSDLAVNEEVGLKLTSTSPQTVTSVEIRLDHVAGTVTAVAGNTITISGHHGDTSNVLVSSTTAFTSDGAASTLAAVVVGAVICASGLPDTTVGTLDASTVSIQGADASHGFGHGHDSDGSNSSHSQGQGQWHGQGHGFGRGHGRGRH